MGGGWRPLTSPWASIAADITLIHQSAASFQRLPVRKKKAALADVALPLFNLVPALSAGPWLISDRSM